ncbi:MAG: LmbE family protein [Saprospirales bacterium]|nr:MAG: LmbE family protein [Saprospirales bacterium]
MKRVLLLLAAFWGLSSMSAQVPPTYTSSEIHHEIKKFNTLANVLYIAAHPDDENTRLISWLANHRLAHVTYISTTRGGGGQNLIGPELGDEMGVIRTQELLGARRIDGGHQFFARTRDFGFSKNSEETFDIWGKEESLSDVVWAVRKLRPDILINRFFHEVGPRPTHGHHTASAILGYEAFNLSNDPEAFPYHLDYTEPWQPSRLFFNTSWWFFGSRDRFEEETRESDMLIADIGVYFPLLGESNSEIAGRSRSMHKCQGFGAASTRGTQNDYMKFLKGKPLEEKKDIFEGIETSWDRVDPSGRLKELGEKLDREYDHTAPHHSLGTLLEMRDQILEIEDEFWRVRKLEEVENLILLCTGLFLETTSDRQSAAAGEEVEFTSEITLRSDVNVKLTGMRYYPEGPDSTMQLSLGYNRAYKFFNKMSIPSDASLTTPYWLDKRGTAGLQQVDDQSMRGKPETLPYLYVDYTLEIDGREIEYRVPVIYKYVDPADGEIYERFDILPVATVNFRESNFVFGSNEPREIEVSVRATKAGISGHLNLILPEGWESEESRWDFDLPRKGQSRVFTTELIPPEYPSDEMLKLEAVVDGKRYDRSLTVIEYDYIPKLNVLSHAESRAVRVDVDRVADRIAYIMGAGDDIPSSLRQIGYKVDMINPDDLMTTDFSQYSAVVTGIRAYNTVPQLEFAQERLFEYVEQGGILVLQYNTGFRLVTDEISPFDLNISRYRVTDHTAEVRFLAPEHPVLNHPNKISEEDFDDWVQERGLYFADEWAEEFTAILGSNDPGEPSRDGSLLIAPYGDGYYVYTGISWFRQLPAGVPGAYRIFANILSLGIDE